MKSLLLLTVRGGWIAALPRPASVDLDLQRPAQKCPHGHDDGEDADAGKSRIDGHRADDVARDEDLEADED